MATTIKTRFTWMLALPMLLTVAVGCAEQADTTDEQLRGIEVEPCLPEDCIPLSPVIEGDCPPGTEPISWGQCVNSEEGECVMEFYEECVPVDEEPEPEPEPETETEEPPHPSPDNLEIQRPH